MSWGEEEGRTFSNRVLSYQQVRKFAERGGKEITKRVTITIKEPIYLDLKELKVEKGMTWTELFHWLLTKYRE